MKEITWTCHICGKERPDHKISVYTKDTSANLGLSPGTIKQNIRYCNDKPECKEKAKDFDFFDKE